MLVIMLEYILELHASSQAKQTQSAQWFGLSGNGDRLGEGSNHHLSYHLWDLLSHSRFLPVTWLWVPWPKETTCATACYSCRLFYVKKWDRKRGWLDKVKDTPSGQDDCKRKLLTHSSILSASQNHPPSTSPLPSSLKVLTLFFSPYANKASLSFRPKD